MHSPSLFQTSTAHLFQKQNEKQSTNFQFFKPGNSSVSYTLVCCPATGPFYLINLWSLLNLRPCLAFTFLPLCFHASRSSWLLASFLTHPPHYHCLCQPALAVLCAVTYPCLIGVENMQKAPGVEVSQVYVLLPTELKPHLQFAGNISRLIVFLSWSVLADECCQKLQLATAFNKSSSCT